MSEEFVKKKPYPLQPDYDYNFSFKNLTDSIIEWRSYSLDPVKNLSKALSLYEIIHTHVDKDDLSYPLAMIKKSIREFVDENDDYIVKKAGSIIKSINICDDCLSQMMDTLKSALALKRVESNHAIISKRFNIKSIIEEYPTEYLNSDMIDPLVFKICSFIDTYRLSVPEKCSLMVEEIYYALSKYRKDILSIASIGEEIKSTEEITKNVLTDVMLYLYINYMDERGNTLDSECLDKLDKSIYLKDANIDLKSFRDCESKYIAHRGFQSLYELIPIYICNHTLGNIDDFKDKLSSWVTMPEHVKNLKPFLFSICTCMYLYNDRYDVSKDVSYLNALVSMITGEGNPSDKYNSYNNSLKVLNDYITCLDISDPDVDTTKIIQNTRKVYNKMKEIATNEVHEGVYLSSDDYDVLFSDLFKFSEAVEEYKTLSDKVSKYIYDESFLLTLNPIQLSLLSSMTLGYPEIIDYRKLLSAYKETAKNIRKVSYTEGDNSIIYAQFRRISPIDQDIERLTNLIPHVKKEVIKESFDYNKDIPAYYDYYCNVNDSLLVLADTLKLINSNETTLLNKLNDYYTRAERGMKVVSDKSKPVVVALGKVITGVMSLGNTERSIKLKTVILPRLRTILKIIIGGTVLVVNPLLAILYAITTIALSNSTTKKETDMIKDELEANVEIIDQQIRDVESGEHKDYAKQKQLLILKKKYERSLEKINDKYKSDSDRIKDVSKSSEKKDDDKEEDVED